MRDKSKSYKHYSFRMDNESWAAVDYLRENNINMSLVVRKALKKEVERQELIKKAFPE
jgi:predicted transcriptional regulator